MKYAGSTPWVIALLTAACAPNAPTAVTAKPANHQATVSWSAPAPRMLGAVTHFTVHADPGGASTTVDATSTSATVLNLVDGTSYAFTVTAANWRGDGPESEPSAAVTPAGPPGAPTDVECGDTDNVARSISITWTPPKNTGGAVIASYMVKAFPGDITATTKQTSVDVKGLAFGVSYTFTVHATNSAGVGPDSNPSEPAELPCDVVMPPSGETHTASDESENDTDEEGAAVTAMKQAAVPSCLFQSAVDYSGPAVTCVARNTLGGDWGTGNANISLSFERGERFEGEYSQYGPEGDTPGPVSQKLVFAPPAKEERISEILKTCECDIGAVDRDDHGLPSVYRCKAVSDETMSWVDVFSLARNSEQQVTSLLHTTEPGSDAEAE